MLLACGYVHRFLRLGALADEGCIVGVMVKGQELRLPVVPIATAKKITATINAAVGPRAGDRGPGEDFLRPIRAPMAFGRGDTGTCQAASFGETPLLLN